MGRIAATLHGVATMPMRHDILLFERVRAGRHIRMFAVLDELTLTYDVALRVDGERSRTLHTHLRSLQQARDWAAGALEGPVDG